MTASIATVTVKGQVTIPVEVRRKLDIRQGDQLLFMVEGDRIVLNQVNQRPLSELYNSLPATRSFPGHQAIRQELRTELGERIARGEE